MGHKNPESAERGPALRWSSLVFALALVLALVSLATQVEAVPSAAPASPDAVDIPSLGHTFYGTVKNAQGVSLPNGTTVMAKAASGPWTGNVTTKVGPPDANSGSYFLTVPADDPDTSAIDGAVAGTPIVFYVAGVKAKMYDVAQSKWVENYAWSSGGLTNLNLQAEIYYTITASAGAGGAISPSGAVSVPLGGNKTFTITPDTGFLIADVLVDNVSVGPVATYTFSNVSANHTISASFVRSTGDIAGYVFLDTNGNGVREAGETAGIAGVTITLLLPGGGTQTAVTAGADGAYIFGSLAPGQYTVQQAQPLGYASTSPDSVAALVTAGSVTEVNFGEQLWTPTPTVSPTETVSPTPSPTPDLNERLYLPLVMG